MSFLLFLLTVLAVFRLTWFVVFDHLFQLFWGWFRGNVLKGDGFAQGELDYLVSCVWCSSFWFAGFVTFGLVLFVSVPVPLLWWFGSAAAAAIIADRLD